MHCPDSGGVTHAHRQVARRFILSSDSSAASKTSSSPSSRQARSSAMRPSRRRRAVSINLRPFPVAWTTTCRRSERVRSRRARPDSSRPFRIREIAGRETISASASSPTVRGPAKQSTDSNDSRSGVSPVEASTVRTPRRMWIAAECNLFATRLTRLSESLDGSGGFDIYS